MAQQASQMSQSVVIVMMVGKLFFDELMGDLMD